MFIIGIDGGGTSTQGAIATLDGTIIAEAQVGATNYHNVGLQTAGERLDTLLKDLLQKAGAANSELTGVCLGGAGIDCEADRVAINQLMKNFGWEIPFIAVNDAVTALSGGNRSTEGMVIISGTGSIGIACYEGYTVRCGGWGQLIDDVGSGYFMGITALKGIMEAYDGRRLQTGLWKPVAEHLGIRQEEDIIHFLYHPQTGKEKIAALAPYVIQLAGEDSLATEIMEAGIKGLLQIVKGLLDQLNAKGIPHRQAYALTLGGSLLLKSDKYREAFSRAVAEQYPEVDVHLPYEGPVAGALRIINDYLMKEREPNA